MMAKPIRALGLRYPIIQFLITSVMCPAYMPLFSGYSFRPHVSGEFGIRVRNFLNLLSRVEIFEYALIPESCWKFLVVPGYEGRL